MGAPSGSSAMVVKLTRPCRTCITRFLPLSWLFWLRPCPWKGFLGRGQSLIKWSALPQLKQRLVLLFCWNCWLFGLRPNCCGCCGGTGGLYPPCGWGGRKTDLLDGAFRCGSVNCALGTTRYLGDWTFEGPVGVFRFFSARCAIIQSSWVRTILTSSLKVLALTRFRRSLSLVLRPRRKRSCFLASLSAWLWPNRLNYSGSSELAITMQAILTQRTSNGTTHWSVGSPPDTTMVQQDQSRFTSHEGEFTITPQLTNF
jgi:hypothetical protein